MGKKIQVQKKRMMDFKTLPAALSPDSGLTNRFF
jgi:hypothetical protein